jgi:hypothetical protein
VTTPPRYEVRADEFGLPPLFAWLRQLGDEYGHAGHQCGLTAKPMPVNVHIYQCWRCGVPVVEVVVRAGAAGIVTA